MAAVPGEPARTSDQAALAVITGGGGDLARFIRNEVEERGYTVHAPGHDELDVTSADMVRSYFSGLPRVDLLILNAGICQDSLLEKMNTEQFNSVLDCNLSGAFRCAGAALRLMTKQQAGHIIAIGSYSALSGPAGQANYAAAKAGLISLTQSLAREYGSRNIRVNCVLPGFLETRMTAKLSEAKKARFRAEHMLGRFNTPACVARFVAFLDCELPHASGQVFNLDSRIHRWT